MDQPLPPHQVRQFHDSSNLERVRRYGPALLPRIWNRVKLSSVARADWDPDEDEPPLGFHSFIEQIPSLIRPLPHPLSLSLYTSDTSPSD